MSGINAIIANHFKLFFRYMANKPLDKFGSRNGFGYEFVVFMAIIVKDHVSPIIAINPRGCDDRSPQIASNVFEDLIRITVIGFGIHIKAIFTVTIDFSFDLFKRMTDVLMKLIKKSGAKGMAQELKVKMIHFTPKF